MVNSVLMLTGVMVAVMTALADTAVMVGVRRYMVVRVVVLRRGLVESRRGMVVWRRGVVVWLRGVVVAAVAGGEVGRCGGRAGPLGLQ